MSQINTTWQEIKNLSVARWYDPYVSLLVILGTFFWLKDSSISHTYLVLTIVLVTSVYMVGIELLTRTPKLISDYKNKLEAGEVNRPDLSEVLKHVFIKYLGVVAGILIIFFFYWFIPEYDELKYLQPILEVRDFVLILTLLFAFPMIFLSEYFLGHKNDGTYNLGLFLSLQIDKIHWLKLRDGFLEWTIRTFFLTLNFTSSVFSIKFYRENPLSFMDMSYVDMILRIEVLIFLLIIIVITPGYFFSWRFIGSENKVIDSTWFGWTFLLICYQPFITPFFNDTFQYWPEVSKAGNSPMWAYLFNGNEVMLLVLGFGIVWGAWIHYLGEAVVGIRSSNLGNRGVVTNSVFAWTKHPVYVSKFLVWFCLTLPFFNGATVLESLQLGIAFLVVVGIYLNRTLSEERILANDPDYRKYAYYMDQHSVFAFMGRLFPAMTFEWRYNYWKRAGFYEGKKYLNE
jgi:protein-S-isoprenylcysteine O-methyltransferase Ste14